MLRYRSALPLEPTTQCTGSAQSESSICLQGCGSSFFARVGVYQNQVCIRIAIVPHTLLFSHLGPFENPPSRRSSVQPWLYCMLHSVQLTLHCICGFGVYWLRDCQSVGSKGRKPQTVMIVDMHALVRIPRVFFKVGFGGGLIFRPHNNLIASNT